MSMTQLALVKRADLPTKSDLIKAIGQLEHKIEILDDFEKFDNIDGISCKFNDTETFFELYFNSKEEILDDFPHLENKFKDYDYGVSFILGADFAAGASIGIICVALIDLCNSTVFYMDDDMLYTREMLLADTPLFIQELEKQKSMNSTPTKDIQDKKQTNNLQSDKQTDDKRQHERLSFWTKLKRLWS
jgi:hypothetical protein